MRHILFLCTEGNDTPGPSNHLISSLIEDLLDSGFHVTWVQSRRKKINDDIPDNLKYKDNLSVITIDRKIIEKTNLIKRYFEEVAYHFGCMRVWRNINDIDAVFVQSCPTVVFPIALLRLFMKKPILYSIQDMWPGSAINSGVLKYGFLSRMFCTIQKLVYRYSTVLTVISDDMKSKVVNEGVSEKKIFMIPNWYDDRTVHEVDWDANRFVKKYNLDKNKFYIQYAGTMGYVFDYKKVIEVAELLKSYKDIEFHMIGQGSQKDLFIKEKELRELDNIVFFPLEPQEMVSDVYSACSTCLIPLKKGIIGNSVPSKAALLMACNRVIINSVDEDSDYFKMFIDNDIGISVSNDDPQALANAILQLYQNPEKRKQMAKNANEFGKKYFARSNNTRKFIELFIEMTKSNKEVEINV